ncbi:MAG TPA: SURF1 family protein [Acidimicrobiales bacterium]
MYRFALRPRWIAGHVLVAVAVAVMVSLAFWQFRRLDERKAQNERVAERMAAPEVDLGEVAGEPLRDVEFRTVAATGTFDGAHDVLVGFRTRNGLPGYHVVTSLVLDDGTAVLVNRGFVPLDLAERWRDEPAPAGPQRVVGILRGSYDARTDTATPGEDGAPPKLNAVDVDAIDPYVPRDLLPFHVELQSPVPPGFPEPLPPLDLGEGPHLSYAIQWLSFATVAAVGWGFVLRRTARRRTGRAMRVTVP